MVIDHWPGGRTGWLHCTIFWLGPFPIVAEKKGPRDLGNMTQALSYRTVILDEKKVQKCTILDASDSYFIVKMHEAAEKTKKPWI